MHEQVHLQGVHLHVPVTIVRVLASITEEKTYHGSFRVESIMTSSGFMKHAHA